MQVRLQLVLMQTGFHSANILQKGVGEYQETMVQFFAIIWLIHTSEISQGCTQYQHALRTLLDKLAAFLMVELTMCMWLLMWLSCHQSWDNASAMLVALLKGLNLWEKGAESQNSICGRKALNLKTLPTIFELSRHRYQIQVTLHLDHSCNLNYR